MNRRERLLLLVFFALVIGLLVSRAPLVAGACALAGLAVGVVAAGRVRRLGARVDRLVGEDALPQGFQPRRVLSRVVVHLVVLAVLLLVTAVVPFVGGTLFVAAAAAATGAPAALTAAGLRRHRLR